MKRKCILHLIVIMFLFLGNATVSFGAEEDGVGMVTGGDTGTYYRFGKDIAEKAKQVGLNIAVKTSKGSIDNIKRLDSRENAAFAIVQADVLSFLKRNPQMASTARKLRLIFPLYKEEVHLFANTLVQRLEDLQGKRVVLGLKESGNWLTAVNVLHIMGVEPGEVLYLDPPDAVKAVLQNRADAMFYVVGKPAKLFLNLNDVQAEYPQLLEKVHFVPMQDQKLLRDYVTSNLTSNEYAWFDGNVPTIAVKAVLVSFDFSSSRSTYYQTRCQQLGKLGQVLRTQLTDLQQNGHPKWREVDLEERIGIWELDTCSRQSTPDAVGGDLDIILNQPW